MTYFHAIQLHEPMVYNCHLPKLLIWLNINFLIPIDSRIQTLIKTGSRNNNWCSPTLTFCVEEILRLVQVSEKKAVDQGWFPKARFSCKEAKCRWIRHLGQMIKLETSFGRSRITSTRFMCIITKEQTPIILNSEDWHRHIHCSDNGKTSFHF